MLISILPIDRLKIDDLLMASLTITAKGVHGQLVTRDECWRPANISRGSPRLSIGTTAQVSWADSRGNREPLLAINSSILVSLACCTAASWCEKLASFRFSTSLSPMYEKCQPPAGRLMRRRSASFR